MMICSASEAEDVKQIGVRLCLVSCLILTVAANSALAQQQVPRRLTSLDVFPASRRAVRHPPSPHSLIYIQDQRLQLVVYFHGPQQPARPLLRSLHEAFRASQLKKDLSAPAAEKERMLHDWFSAHVASSGFDDYRVVIKKCYRAYSPSRFSVPKQVGSDRWQRNTASWVDVIEIDICKMT